MELERIGLIPRSILRMFDRFALQFSVGTQEQLVKQFRFSKYLLLTSVKSLLILFFVPLLTMEISKVYFFHPLISSFWNTKQTEIFLNYDLQEKAFFEIQDFEEKTYFESLITETYPKPVSKGHAINLNKKEKENSKPNTLVAGILYDTSHIQTDFFPPIKIESKIEPFLTESPARSASANLTLIPHTNFNEHSSYEGLLKNISHTSLHDNSVRNQKLAQEKILELAKQSNNLSIEALSSLLADLLSLITLCFLLIKMRMSIMNTTAFLFESFFSLKDSKKSFLMLLFTDLLVGFHSPRGWEVLFHSLFEHFGFPENQNIILILVGTFPVVLDALFKYWIFRHLNRHSPATVATYQSMVE
jgi:hypothetical protein